MSRSLALFFPSLFVAMLSLSSSSPAPYRPRDLYVGGKDGWVLNPPEDFNSWAARNEFHIKDKLVFKYKKREDSVLVVSKEDYYSCTTSNPIKKKTGGGRWRFKLRKLGPVFFISGASGHCEKGEKMSVLVTPLPGPGGPSRTPYSPQLPPGGPFSSSPSGMRASVVGVAAAVAVGAVGAFLC